MSTPDAQPSALEALTPVQRDAVIATATAYLVDAEALAGEWLEMLRIDEVPPRVLGGTVSEDTTQTITFYAGEIQ